MDQNVIFPLGLGLTPPWAVTEQRLDMEKSPHELHLQIAADRGALFPCPECGDLCKAHDFTELTWRHLNFFQHHCYINAPVPRTNCDKHGIKRINVPWAREGSHFALLFEQAALTLVREMPVRTASRFMQVTDNRIWRIIAFYVNRAVQKLDLSNLKALSLDETKAKRHHRYVTVFIDLDRKERPVVFATPGKGKDTVLKFKEFFLAHGGSPEKVIEVVSDMSGAFVSAIKTHFKEAKLTVDWFHVVQLFTKAVDEVRRTEAKKLKMPKTTRWAVLKSADGELTEKQIDALAELAALDLHTSTAWRVKEALRWIRKAPSEQAAKWRLTSFLNYAKELIGHEPALAPVRKAINTVEKYRYSIEARWRSFHSNGRIEGLNSFFQAARIKARG